MSLRKVLAPAVLAAWIGCGPAPPHSPNVLLIILDTTRADALSCYNSSGPLTPHIDRLALRGLLFEEAVAHNPYTLGSIATILTSLEPDVHGLKGHDKYRLDDKALTLAEHLAASGYETAAFVSALPIRKDSGLGQGFDVYDDDLSMPFEVYDPQYAPLQLQGAQRRGGITVGRALRWLETRPAKSRPFFLLVHLYDPHNPYDAPAEFALRYPQRPYFGEIAYTDALVGEILDALDRERLTDRTLVAVVGDHGEGLGEHGEAGHGMFLYDVTLRVPMIVAGPGVEPGRARGPAPLVDLAPTLVAACRLEIPDSFHGADLLAGRAPGDAGRVVRLPEKPVYIETYWPRVTHRWSELIGWREGGLKYIRGPVPELFDLKTDPRELSNRIAEEPDRAREMSARLDAHLARDRGPRLEATAPGADAETLEKLRSLGYVGNAPVSPEIGAPGWEIGLPDPKEAIHEWNRSQEAQAAYRRALASLRGGAFAAGLEWADRALALESGKLEAVYVKAQCLNALGREGAAVAFYEAYLEERPEDADAWNAYGTGLDKLSRRAEARRAYERALAVNPDHPLANRNMGYVHIREERWEEALPYYEKSRRLAPDDAVAMVDLARLYVQRGEFALGEEVLEEALAHNGEDAMALLLLGHLRIQRGDRPGAAAIFEKFLRLHPRHPEAPRVRGLLGSS